ncbi:MAG: hypothetical protein LBE33_06895 [Zoogloeaceae bacterium]|jgi:type IV secretory pathway VirB2 component (pilin)|nr:hypothetical protein [Zoogloeaceae bacterium]
MTRLEFVRALTKHGLFIFGIYFGVAVIVHVDVNLSVAAIDPSNSDTWPEMAPQIRYFFIPILGTIVAIAAVCLNALVNFFHRRDFHWAIWFALGLAYSFMLSGLPLIRITHMPMLSGAIGLLFTVFVVAAVRVIFGKKSCDAQSGEAL